MYTTKQIRKKFTDFCKTGRFTNDVIPSDPMAVIYGIEDMEIEDFKVMIKAELIQFETNLQKGSLIKKYRWIAVVHDGKGGKSIFLGKLDDPWNFELAKQFLPYKEECILAMPHYKEI